MGNCRSSSVVAPNKEVTLLLLGLDNSGKTTIIANLSGEPTEGTTPSIGFSRSNLVMDEFQVTLYDLGGGARLRNIWKNYYPEAWGSIFVVDASAVGRFGEAKEALSGIVGHDKMRGKPLLVLANKQDCEGAVGEEQVSRQLDLAEILGENMRHSRVVKCVALLSASGNKQDLAIVQGVKWLLQQLGLDYGQTSQRVSTDMAEQNAAQARRRRERAERVKKIKEERERQRRLAGVADEEEVDEGAAEGGDPFKPIQQAVAETEARERAVKARNKEIREKLNSLQDAEPADEGAGKDRGHEQRESGVVELTDGRSQPSSGLSSSSESLTDVTPNASSSESLHSPVQSDSAVDPLRDQDKPPLTTTTTTQTTSQAGGGKEMKKKKKRRSTLLSRLKNRSKTAPMPVSTEDTTPDPHTTITGGSRGGAPRPLSGRRTSLPANVMKNTWTAAKLEPVETTTDPQGTSTSDDSPTSSPQGQTQQEPVLVEEGPSFPATCGTSDGGGGDGGGGPATSSSFPQAAPSSQLSHPSLPSSSSPSLSSGRSVANMQGLPQLPRSRVILPPLRITKQPVGMTDRVLQAEEDIAAIPKEDIIQLSQPPNAVSVVVEPLSS